MFNSKNELIKAGAWIAFLQALLMLLELGPFGKIVSTIPTLGLFFIILPLFSFVGGYSYTKSHLVSKSLIGKLELGLRAAYYLAIPTIIMGALVGIIQIILMLLSVKTFFSPAGQSYVLIAVISLIASIGLRLGMIALSALIGSVLASKKR